MSFHLDKLRRILKIVVTYRIELSLIATSLVLAILSIIPELDVSKCPQCEVSQSINLMYVIIHVHCQDSSGIIILQYLPKLNLLVLALLLASYAVYRIVLTVRRGLSTGRSIYRVFSDVLLVVGVILLLPLPEVVIIPDATRHYVLIPVMAAPLSAILEVMCICTLLIGELALKQEDRVSEVFVSLDMLLEETPEEKPQ